MLVSESILTSEQNNVINSKVFGNNIIKGGKNSGKTTAAIYRSLYLKNNYCLYEEDKILMICNTIEDKINAENLYIEAEECNNCINLFSMNKDKFYVTTFEEIISECFSKYKECCNCEYEIVTDNNKKQNIMKKCIIKTRESYGNLKILNFDYVNFFINEIKWIKSFNYMNIDEYQSAVRTGRKVEKGEGPQRLLKNSAHREVIFELMHLYNEMLKKENFIDYEDMQLLLLNHCEKDFFNKYTHLIVDDAQSLSKVQLQIINEILNEPNYSSMNFIINLDESSNKNSYLVKNKRINNKAFDGKIKTFKLTQEIDNHSFIDNNSINVNVDVNNMYSSMEHFKYYDIKHSRKYEFMREDSNTSEIMVKSEGVSFKDESPEIYETEELKQLPVYSDIAAGEPILINSELEGSFYIPKLWIKGMNDCFILKVRGDSMIGADINNGDLVVIKKQYSANHKDIVAVDIHGSATLKRLFMSKEKIMLLPENEKYDPIMVDEETLIMGIAVGVIKSSSSVLY